MATTGSINGAGRIKFFEGPRRVYELTKVQGGLYSAPIDMSLSELVDDRAGDILTRSEFVAAARELGLGGAHGSPTFGAIAKHFLEGHPNYSDLMYAFAKDGPKPDRHYVLITDITYSLIESGIRIKGLTERRRMVARTVLGLVSDEEFERFAYLNSGLTDAEVGGIIEELENEGFDATTLRFEGHEVVKTNTGTQDRVIVVVRGSMLANVGGEGFLLYNKSNPHIRVPAHAPVESFIPDGGCEVIQATKIDE